VLADYVTRNVGRKVPEIRGGGAKQTPCLLANLEGESPVIIAKETIVQRDPKRAPADELEALHKELARFAARIKEVMEAQKADDVAVGEISGPPNLESTSGPGIQYLLIQALKSQKVIVKKNASLVVKGDYLLADDARDKERDCCVLKVEARMMNMKGEKLLDLQAELRGYEVIARLIGPNADLNKDIRGDAGDRNAALRKKIEAPGAFIEGSKVKASERSLCSVEVLIGGVARPAEKIKGLPFVSLKKGDEYVVRIFNPGPHEAAVSLTIDGLDMFILSDFKNPTTGAPRYTHLIVPPGKSLDIKGWFHNLTKSSPFQVVDFKDCALAKATGDAALLVGNPKVGTLTVCYHTTWTGDDPPAGSTGKADTSDPCDGTESAKGFGPSKKSQLIKRTIGALREVVSIRYRK
jgi:hypothetical protein